MTVELVVYVLGMGVGLISAHTIFRSDIVVGLMIGVALMLMGAAIYTMAGMPRHGL